MSRLSIVYDRFLLIMLATIALAMALPASGEVAETLHAVLRDQREVAIRHRATLIDQRVTSQASALLCPTRM